MSASEWPTVRLRRAEVVFKRRFILDRSALVMGENLRHSIIKETEDKSVHEWLLHVTIKDSPWTNESDSRAFFAVVPERENHEVRLETTFVVEEFHDDKVKPKLVHNEHFPLRLIKTGGYDNIFPDGIPVRPTLKQFVVLITLTYVGDELLKDDLKLEECQETAALLLQGSRLQDMLDSGKHSDVVFIIDGKEIHAHRQILAAVSNVFSAMFEHESQEQQTGRVVITDCKEQVFREMLRCLYSGREPTWRNDDFTLDLLLLADKYCLQNIKVQCIRRMLATLNVYNVTALLQTAYLLNMEAAKEVALIFFKGSLKRVLNTKSWKEFQEKNPTLAAKILQTACIG